MDSRYRIEGREVLESDDDFQEILGRAYRRRERPLCLCRPTPLEMYIAKVDGRYFIKRMPHSGRFHDAMCDSYELPPEFSGLAHLSEAAITDRGEEGTVLRVDYSLARKPGRSPAAAAGVPAESVRADSIKLTLRSTLHFLWEQAGFNRWSPRMEGRRNWGLIRYHLLATARNKTVKGLDLGTLLYIPEVWSKENALEIRRRREIALARLAPTSEATYSLMLLVGECKAIQATPFGFKLITRHAPDFPLFLNETSFRRIEKRFEMELALNQAAPERRLLFIATFGLNLARSPVLDEIAFMLCSREWIPIDTPDEAALVQRLVEDRRFFIKGLRYNLPRTTPLASAALLDAGDRETALYIVPSGATPAFEEGIAELQEGSPIANWTWKVNEGVTPPALPAPRAAALP